MKVTTGKIQQQAAEIETVAAPRDITQLLQAWCAGDQTALNELIPRVEAELRSLAHRYMGKEHPGHILQTTALIGEAYLRLVAVKPKNFAGRAEFYALSANLMRNILVDYFRREARQGAPQRVALDEALTIARERPADLVALDAALCELAAFDPRKSRVVELRYFGGLTEAEVATVLKISLSTVKKDWKAAKTWLYRELSKDTQ